MERVPLIVNINPLLCLQCLLDFTRHEKKNENFLNIFSNVNMPINKQKVLCLDDSKALRTPNHVVSWTDGKHNSS